MMSRVAVDGMSGHDRPTGGEKVAVESIILKHLRTPHYPTARRVKDVHVVMVDVVMSDVHAVHVVHVVMVDVVKSDVHAVHVVMTFWVTPLRVSVTGRPCIPASPFPRHTWVGRWESGLYQVSNGACVELTVRRPI
jgi:hypothetical protein